MASRDDHDRLLAVEDELMTDAPEHHLIRGQVVPADRGFGGCALERSPTAPRLMRVGGTERPQPDGVCDG